VHSVRAVFAIRFCIGVLESGFAVGVITVMGSWYTPAELAKRIAIFYSASYAASMFSGYLQAGIYRGMDGHLGMSGWRWLFIFCGVLSVPGALYGYYAAPDNPYDCKVRWLRAAQKQKFIERAERFEKGRPVRPSWAKLAKVFRSWRIYVVTLTLM
jgi:MFS transporter, ACS family, pantothenate transporter